MDKKCSLFNVELLFTVNGTQGVMCLEVQRMCRRKWLNVFYSAGLLILYTATVSLQSRSVHLLSGDIKLFVNVCLQHTTDSD